MTELHPFEQFKAAEKHPLSSLFVINTLREQFIDMRTAAGMTQQQVCEDTDWSLSKMNRFEIGHTRITVTDARALLDSYGIEDREERAKVEARVREEREVRSNTNPAWNMYSNLASTPPLAYWQHEAEAESIRIFRPTFSPDFMWPDNYASAVEHTPIHPRTPEQTQAATDLRRQRAAYLLGKYGPKLEVIIDRSVLDRAIGGYNTMATAIDGLRYLNTVGQRMSGDKIPAHLNPDISIRVLAYEHADYAAVWSNYSIFAGAQPEYTVAYNEGLSVEYGELRAENASTYQRYFQTMANNIPGPEKTNAILDSIQANNAKR